MFDQDKDEKDSDTSQQKSEEGSTEEESDTFEESEGSEETEEEESEESEGGKSFLDYDVRKLPKELIPHYKRMQASFTRKMQRASLVAKKAEAFDMLAEDPDFQELLQSKQSDKFKSNVRAKGRRDSDEADEDENAPLTKKDLQNFFAEFRNEQEGQNRKTAYRQEMEKFFKDHPESKDYIEELKETLERHPSFTYEDAWRWITTDDRELANRLSTNNSKKRADSMKPNRSQGKEPEKRKGKMTIPEAARLAKKSLGWK